jgi:UDP-N-acetylglucosamine diphosphorylase/glucosamine-1-phosphate N-acetyltransferase
VVLDAREGPIVLGERTQVFPHTWIRGPFLCLEDCHLLGGRIGGGTVLGKACRVRGEVEASVFLGHDNKAHDGFVGHSLLGEWVNLGALTTTSDLKNNYGTVHLDAYGRSFDSGLMKVGAFLGDHVKTRIGTMLNTGSVLGLGANVFGDAGVFPKWIRDFSWGAGPGAATYEWDRFLATATVVLSRRGSSMNEPLRTALHAAFDRAREERETHA